MTSVTHDAISIVRASERLQALLELLKMLSRMTDDVREVTYDLGPELAAIDERIIEVTEHVRSAMVVLIAKVGEL